jgi:hypothetical protein
MNRHGGRSIALAVTGGRQRYWTGALRRELYNLRCAALCPTHVRVSSAHLLAVAAALPVRRTGCVQRRVCGDGRRQKREQQRKQRECTHSLQHIGYAPVPSHEIASGSMQIQMSFALQNSRRY